MDDYINDDDAIDNAQRVCKVYDRDDVFTLLVQILLAVLALGSLYIKRMQETPRRTFQTWFLDVSKQGIGACYAHVLNMMIAAIISQNIRGESQLEDQCAWYGMSYIIDTSLGLFLAIVFLRWLDTIANHRQWKPLMKSGVYEGEDAIPHWLAQVTAWMVILTITKVLIYVFMWVCSSPLAYAGALLFAPLQVNIRFELVFVMILFPGCLNVIYFWIADGFLKAKSEHSAAHEPDGLEDKRVSLVEENAAPDTPAPTAAPYSATPWSSISTANAPTPGSQA